MALNKILARHITFKRKFVKRPSLMTREVLYSIKTREKLLKKARTRHSKIFLGEKIEDNSGSALKNVSGTSKSQSKIKLLETVMVLIMINS